jgi:uncharacterized protein YaeQ
VSEKKGSVSDVPDNAMVVNGMCVGGDPEAGVQPPVVPHHRIAERGAVADAGRLHGAPRGDSMSLKSTVIKVELQVTDMDRHYYALHNLTLAQHPSETEQRLMVRVVAFALYASDRLEFGRGLSAEDEPDLWNRDYTGDIEQWIDLGQPDESRIRKACGRAREAVVIGYAGAAASIWWTKNAGALARFGNLTVIDLDPAAVDALAGLVQRSMRLTAMIQDGELQVMSDSTTVAVTPTIRMHGPA